MKTTSYEISKKLADIGFETKYDYIVFKFNCDVRFRRAEYSNDWEENGFPSYDLEEILAEIKHRVGTDLNITLTDKLMVYSYDNCDGKIEDVVEKIEDSLADAAARLLISLHERGII